MPSGHGHRGRRGAPPQVSGPITAESSAQTWMRLRRTTTPGSGSGRLTLRLRLVMRLAQRLQVGQTMVVASNNVIDLIRVCTTHDAARLAMLTAVAIAAQNPQSQGLPVARQARSAITGLPAHDHPFVAEPGPGFLKQEVPGLRSA